MHIIFYLTIEQNSIAQAIGFILNNSKFNIIVIIVRQLYESNYI